MAVPVDKNKYDYMENVLNRINKKHISPDEKYIKQNNPVLIQVLKDLTDNLKSQCKLFCEMYRVIYYGGSYYDHLKICDPGEYDLDVLLVLPKIIEPKIVNSDKSGFVYLQAAEFPKLSKRPEAPKYNGLDSLMEGDYFSTDKLKSWFEKLMTKTIGKPENRKFPVKVGEELIICNIEKFSKNGPAFKLQLSYRLCESEESFNFDIDLVPCFVFSVDSWPGGKFRKNPCDKKGDFFVVPKKPSISNSSEDVSRYWRLSFQDQERYLISGNKYKALKPTCKLIKKIRDFHDHKKICSYYIKTVFLWEAEKKDEKFWQLPLSYVFVEMLRVYAEYLKNYTIPYYWYKSYNLLENVNRSTCLDFGNKISNIIKSIEMNPYDSFFVTKYLLTEEEIKVLKNEVDLGKKHSKHINNLSMVSVADSSTVETPPTQFGVITSTIENGVVTSSVEINNESLSSSSSELLQEVDCGNNIENSSERDLIKQLKVQNDLLIAQNKLLLEQNEVLLQKFQNFESVLDQIVEFNKFGRFQNNSGDNCNSNNIVDQPENDPDESLLNCNESVVL